MKRGNGSVVPFHRPHSLRRAVRLAIAAAVLERHKRAYRSLSSVAVELDQEFVDLPRGGSR